jgi:preprotein translocase subunit YajC
MSVSFQNVAPKAGTPGVEVPAAPAGGAPASSQAAPAGSMMTMLLPILILVPFLFMSFRRNKKEAEARKNLKKDDKVVTQSGLIGILVELNERTAKLKIAPGTTVEVLASSVSSYDPAPAASSKSDDLKDLKEAKATGDKK